MLWFNKKKETPEEKQARLDRIHAEMQQACDQGKDKYNTLCAKVEDVLRYANKPQVTNTVRFASAPYIFPKLKNYQCLFVDWEIWRHNENIYIYCSEVEDYPAEYFGGDAPAIAQIPVAQIQYFRIDGKTYTETKISGGKITQNKHTKEIKQTAIKVNTIQHDNRIVRMSLLVDGVVKTLDFEYSSFDVLTSLLSEKAHL